MSTTHAARYSAFAKRHYGQGRADGEARGEARGERHTIRMVLRARGLTVSEEQADRIEACDDLATLNKWADAALTATDADDIFK